MVIDEDPFPLVALVNITATNLRAVLNAKKDGRIFPNDKIRKVWIPKQYLVHKDELAIKGKVSTTKEKENNRGIHTIQNRKSRRRNPPKERMFFQKRDILFQRERARPILQGGKYLQGLLSLLMSHLDKSGMCCSIRNFLKSSPELKMQRLRAMEKR